MWPMGQLSDPYQQGDDDELGITISGLPGELHEPEGEPEPADEPEGSGGAVVYDLADWSEIERQAITDRLTEAGIPHGWQDAALQVAAVDEAAVENVLDIVEGEADDAAGEPLDADRDQVAYDLSEWEDDQIDMLVDALRTADVAHAWDGDEMYVYSEDEDTVDDLFDKVSHPHELAAEADDGAAGGETMGEIFVAADRFAELGSLADRHGEQRVVSDEHPCLAAWDMAEAGADEVHLLLIDPAVLDRQRPCRVDAENREVFVFEPWAKIAGDVALVPRQR